MPNAQIKINGGSAGVSVDTIALGATVNLSNDDNDGATSWRWEFIYKPPTSSTTLTTPTSSTSTFVADVEGSYLIQLKVNTVIRSRVIAAVKTIDNLRFIASSESNELGGWEETINDNFKNLVLKVEAGGIGDAYGKIQVSSNDTTLGYLEEKVLAGLNTSFVENNNGSNENLTVSTTETIGLPEQVSTPDNLDNYGNLYSFDVDGYTELYYLDNYGNSIQLTSKGLDASSQGYTFIDDFSDFSIDSMWNQDPQSGTITEYDGYIRITHPAASSEWTDVIQEAPNINFAIPFPSDYSTVVYVTVNNAVNNQGAQITSYLGGQKDTFTHLQLKYESSSWQVHALDTPAHVFQTVPVGTGGAATNPIVVGQSSCWLLFERYGNASMYAYSLNSLNNPPDVNSWIQLAARGSFPFQHYNNYISLNVFNFSTHPACSADFRVFRFHNIRGQIHKFS